MTPLDWLTTVPASIPFVLNVMNWTRWPRGTDVVTPEGRVSVLVPARNEEANIEACVRAALSQDPPVHEVIVCDDGSTDATPEILARLQAEDERLRVISAPELPDGWVGKPHACHHLGEAATGDLLVFVDADTVLTPDGVGRVEGLLRRVRAKVLTAFPKQRMGSFPEHAMVPLLSLTFTSWLPLDLIWKHVSPTFLVVNGQVLAFRREAYEAVGGFASVKGEIVDDMAICRRAKEEDQRVVFADGQDLAWCRMYRSTGELWRGFSKNFYEGLGGNPLVLLFALSVYFLAFIFPYLRLGTELSLMGTASLAAVVGVGFNLGARGLLALRLGHSPLSVLVHPFSVLALLAIAANSVRWERTDAIQWRGRTYAKRSERGA